MATWMPAADESPVLFSNTQLYTGSGVDDGFPRHSSEALAPAFTDRGLVLLSLKSSMVEMTIDTVSLIATPYSLMA